MKLWELAVAVYLYEFFTRFDKSYCAFRKATGASCDLTRAANRNELLTWLNKWGCRIDLKHHRKDASDELHEWYKLFGEKLPLVNAKLWELRDDELPACAKLFDSLASKRTSSQRAKTYVKGRPTAAAKILFALRPNVFPLWDRKISEEKGFTGPNGYLGFLKEMRTIALGLKSECERQGIEIDDLPKTVGSSSSNVLKLIDEYNWVTITKAATLPKPALLRQWLDWACQ
jgi:hypothetical protein